MVNLIKGVKTGVVSGVIYGAIGEFTKGLILNYSWDYGIPYYIFLSPIWGAIYGLVLGLIIGLIFTLTYNSLPGTTSIVKGLIFTIFLWLIFSLLLPFIFYYNRFYFNDYFQKTIMVDLILLIFFGFLIGFFWDKFDKLERKCEKCKRVIPKDAILCPYCGDNLKK